MNYELRMILEKLAASRWDLIATPSARYLNRDESKEVLKYYFLPEYKYEILS